VTIAVPTLNQGRFLDEALRSIFQQEISVEVFVLDGGSSDNTIDVIHKWEDQLSGWRSHKDGGQAAAINEGIGLGKAPYVCWLNSDDWYLEGGLLLLTKALSMSPEVSAVYGMAWNVKQKNGKYTPVWVEPFDARRMAIRCIISQPATLIRRDAWELVGGLDCNLRMAMDYDLWWRLYKQVAPLKLIDNFVAANRDHDATKTNNFRGLHYKEAMYVVSKYHGHIPFKWLWAQPYAIWGKLVIRLMRGLV